jgi:hypothetical protein
MLNLWLNALLLHCIDCDISVIELYNCYDLHVGTVYLLIDLSFGIMVEPQYDLVWLIEETVYHGGKSS